MSLPGGGPDQPVALTDVILAEVLQGFDDFVLAASLFRTARGEGVTIRIFR